MFKELNAQELEIHQATNRITSKSDIAFIQTAVNILKIFTDICCTLA